MSARYAKPDGITVVGGAPLRADTLTRALNLAPHLVAADGGADQAMALGHRPDLVIGDLDSLSPTLREALGPNRVLPVQTQDDTDFDKTLGAIKAPFILAVGFAGGRLDHTLAAMNTLVRNPARRIIMDTGHDACILLPPRLSLDLTAGTRVSLFPMAPVACISDGLEWPVKGLPFAPDGKIGTSNAATGGRITLTCDGPGMLLMVPQTVLETLLDALIGAPAWPATVPAR